MNRRFLSVAVFAPSALAHSNRGNQFARESRWLACSRSGVPSASEREESCRLRRLDAKAFRAQARPQPSEDTPPCPTSAWSSRITPASENSQGRSDKRASLRTVEVAREGRNSLHIPPPEAGTLSYCATRRIVRTSPGQPTGIARNRNFPIRASRRGRLENCNR
jgi:hypothetical protein